VVVGISFDGDPDRQRSRARWRRAARPEGQRRHPRPAATIVVPNTYGQEGCRARRTASTVARAARLACALLQANYSIRAALKRFGEPREGDAAVLRRWPTATAARVAGSRRTIRLRTPTHTVHNRARGCRPARTDCGLTETHRVEPPAHALIPVGLRSTGHRVGTYFRGEDHVSRYRKCFHGDDRLRRRHRVRAGNSAGAMTGRGHVHAGRRGLRRIQR
jgi:hypothetical protein